MEIFAEVPFQLLLLNDDSGIVHSRVLGSRGFTVARCVCSGLNWRKRPLGRPIAKQQVATARCGDINASCTISRGGAPWEH